MPIVCNGIQHVILNYNVIISVCGVTIVWSWPITIHLLAIVIVWKLAWYSSNDDVLKYSYYYCLEYDTINYNISSIVFSINGYYWWHYY